MAAPELPEELAAAAEFDYRDPSQNEYYAEYMRMHKVLVGNGGARKLERLYQGLQDESLPPYLVAAGSAAVESSLVRTDIDVNERLGLLEGGVEAWQRALLAHDQLMAHAPELAGGYAHGHRIALDIAVSPLIAGVIQGGVTTETCEQAFRDCLNVAQSNAVYLNLAAKEGNMCAWGDHLGVGYECNALLLFNRRLSPTRFVIPSMARSDSGYFHRNQTHDLLLLRQQWGHIKSAMPIEIKATPSKRDQERYEALLVRGRMHLSVPGKYTPDHTLDAITAVYEGAPSEEQATIMKEVTDRLEGMVRDYYAGEELGGAAVRHTVTVFHENSLVAANHPGLLRKTAAQVA